MKKKIDVLAVMGDAAHEPHNRSTATVSKPTMIKIGVDGARLTNDATE